MRKYLILLFLSVLLFAEEIEKVPFDIFRAYEINKEPINFTISIGSDYPQGPSAIGFDANGRYYISDALNERLILLSREGEYRGEQRDLFCSFAQSLLIVGDDIISNHGNGLAVDRNMKKMVRIFPFDGKGRCLLPITAIDYFYSDSIVIMSCPGYGIYAIYRPGVDIVENNKSIKNIEYVKMVFSSPEKYGLKDVFFDDEYRLFKNNKLISSTFIAYYSYWNSRTNLDMQLFNKYPNDSNWVFKSSNADSVGKDSCGNLYWISGSYLIICNDKGIFIDIINLYNAMYIAKTFPAVHPSGDIYFLDYDDKAVYLYRIKNVWDPEGREAWYRTNAYVTAKELKLRDRGSLDGAQIGMLEEWQRVEIVDRAKASTNIAGVEGRWCKVKTMDGRVGWAFGGYLKEDED
jgi:hypothetical protein